MENDSMLSVEVCFITPQKQFLRKLTVAPGTTIRQAILLCDLSKQFPEIDFTQLKVGIYSKPKTLDTELKGHDRVEIYRPLEIDPMTARRKRVNGKS